MKDIRDYLALFVGAALAIAAVFTVLGLKDLVGPFVSGIFGLATWLYPKYENSRKDSKERVAQLVRGETFSNPLLIFFLLIGFSQFVERTMGAVMGAAIGISLSLAGASKEQMIPVVSAISPMFVVLFLIVASFFIAQFGTERIRHRPLGWIAAALIVNQFADLAVARLALGIELTGEIVILQFGIAALMLPGAIIGWLAASRKRESFLMRQIFDKLSKTDQRALIELAQTLPGQSSYR